MNDAYSPGLSRERPARTAAGLRDPAANSCVGYAALMTRPILVPKSGFAYHALDPRQARGRLSLALLAMLIGALSVAREFGWVLRALSAFDAGVLTLLCIEVVVILSSPVEQMRRRAAAADPGRTFIWIIVLLASASGLFAAAYVLRRAQTLAPESPAVAYILSLTAVIGAWFLTNASFTLRYAHLYPYRRTATFDVQNNNLLTLYGPVSGTAGLNQVALAPWSWAPPTTTAASRP